VANRKPPRPIRDCHDFVFFVTVQKILHLGGNNHGLHVDLRRFQTLNQTWAGEDCDDVHSIAIGSWLGWLAVVGDAPCSGAAFDDRMGRRCADR
jgi:hypothetical protein